MRKNFRSDISIRESFYDYDQSGERIQSLVPENVRIEYFTPAYPRVRLVCSRNGDTFHNCSLSENGRVLVCNLALSRQSLGVGPLLKIVKYSVADSSFPYDFQNKEHIASTGIDLWGGPSDAGELESESVLSEVILRYGYSAYRLAVLDGFEGTEQEWLESLIGNGIQSVMQTQTSHESDGENIVTVTMTDGTQAQFTIRNGKQGKQGERGLQGVPGVANAKYKQVDTLPTASADTMDFIYLTPTQTAGVYDMSYTEQDGNTYTWKPLGTTAIQLADYATKTEVSQLEAKVNEKETGIHIVPESEFANLDHYKDGNQLSAADTNMELLLDNVQTTAGANYRNILIPVSGYYSVRYNSYASSYNYGCLLIDEDNKVVGVKARQSSQENPVFLRIPTTAKYLVYSYNVTTTYSHDVELFKKEAVSETDELKIETVGLTEVLKEEDILKKFDFLSYGYFFPVVGQTVSLSSFITGFSDSATKRNVLIPLDGISNIRLWLGPSSAGYGSAILDENMVVTRELRNSSDGAYFNFTINDGDKYLLFSFYAYSNNRDMLTLISTGKLNDRVTVLESKVEELGGGDASSIVTGLTPKLYKGKTAQNGATVADDYNLTTETIFGDFWLKLADGFKVLEASLFDREGNIASYQIAHPDVYHIGMRASRDFFSTGNTVQQYGYRLVICKTDGTTIADGETVVTDFVSMKDSGLHRWIPEDLPNYDVALRRVDYIQHLRWIPLAKVPNGYGESVANNHFCLPGRVQIGVPYSDVAETRKYVPNNVSIRTFMTAVKNKRSLLYTEELQNNVSKYGMSYVSGNRRCYYGEVCSGFTAWVMGLNTLYLSGIYGGDGIPGMSSVSSPTSQNVRPLDFMWSSGHITIISDIWKDEFGKVKYVVVSEMATPYPYRTLYTAEQFEARLSAVSGTVHRWTGWENLAEPESLPKYSQYNLGSLPYNFPVNEDIMTFAGDYAAFADGDKIVLNCRRANTYTGVQLYKGDTLLQTISITGMSPDGIYQDGEDWVAVDLSSYNLTAGKYKARLTDGTNTTDYTYFEVVSASFSATKNGSNLIVTFSANGGTPVSIEQCQTSGFATKCHPVTASEVTAGTATLSGWEYHSYYPKLYLLVKGEYGTVCKRINMPE